MVKIAIHQPNFIPWFPFFYKMAMADKFIILSTVQFEKNGYQNRYKLSNGKWITKSVRSSRDLICHKRYADDTHLESINMSWIKAIKNTLNIKTELLFDFDTDSSKTENLIKLIQFYEGNVYITNPDAKDKYLDENLMRNAGIEIEYCKVPKNLQKHTFEIFESYGIDGAIKNLPKVNNEKS